MGLFLVELQGVIGEVMAGAFGRTLPDVQHQMGEDIRKELSRRLDLEGMAAAPGGDQQRLHGALDQFLMMAFNQGG